MKNSTFIFSLQLLAGLCAASTAQAQPQETDLYLAARAAQINALALMPMCQIMHGDQVGILMVSPPPMTLPAGVNYEVGRGGGNRARRARDRQPAFEVELWTVTPKVLRFSREGRLLGKKSKA